MVILIGGIISLLPGELSFLFVMSPLMLIVLLILIKYPELSLAVLFNGTIIYFYSVFKMGLRTSSLLTGIFYGTFAISCILGGMLLVAKKKNKFKFSSIDGLFIGFFSMVLVSYFIFSLDSENAYRKLTFAPFLVIAPYFGARFLASEKKMMKFYDYCIYAAAILIIPSLYELMFNPDFSESGRFSLYKFEDGLDNPIMYGITFAILLIIIFIRVLEKKKLKFPNLVLILLSMFLLFRSGSRGAVLSFFVVILFYLFFISKKSVKSKAYAGIFGVFLIVIAYQFIPESTSDFYQYSLSENARLEEGSSIYTRIILWELAINNFKSSPVWGVGEGNVYYGYPHNIVLEILSELGMVGLTLFLLLCFLTIKKGLRFINEDKSGNLNHLMKISLLLFVYSLTEAMFSGHLTQQTHLFVSMGLLATTAQLDARNRKYVSNCSSK